jgi:hypothetical protein
VLNLISSTIAADDDIPRHICSPDTAPPNCELVAAPNYAVSSTSNIMKIRGAPSHLARADSGGTWSCRGRHISDRPASHVKSAYWAEYLTMQGGRRRGFSPSFGGLGRRSDQEGSGLPQGAQGRLGTDEWGGLDNVLATVLRHRRSRLPRRRPRR